MKVFLVMLLLMGSLLSATREISVFHVNHQTIKIDGRLSEPVWQQAPAIRELTMVEPREGAQPTFPTTVKILADQKNIYIGIVCYDDQPHKIISFSKIPDSRMYEEDRIKIVFDTQLDGRSGYIFAVNPEGTRYDALVAHFGEGENANWDGMWDAKTSVNAQGWVVEMVIPIQTFSFKQDITTWGFNVERKIQRLMETDRWAGAHRDYHLGQVKHAGRLNNIPRFSLGWGLFSKGSLIGRITKSRALPAQSQGDYSLDFTQKLSSNISAQLTINTDFAETEVDARRSNLTRFPLFFPEKRDFFLEGADKFDFGIGIGHDAIPFFTRRIGLYQGQKVPLRVGGKMQGTVGKTSFGALITRMDSVSSLVPQTTLGAIRVKRNILEESSLGMIATYGDPTGATNTWLTGLDFVYKTSSFHKDKNFLIGAWFLYNHNPALGNDNTALGLKIDYPNDLWDISFKIKRIGEDFDPSLGFVPRKGIIKYRFGADYMPRPAIKSIRQFFFESGMRLITDLNHRWESYGIFTAPVHFLLESGDRFEFNIAPRGENLPQDFEIEEGVVIKKGPYHWLRYRLELETAAKRWISGQLTWWFGTFYNGWLDQIELYSRIRPLPWVNFTVNYEKNIVQLPAGHFAQNIIGSRIQISFSPDLQISSFIQYDNDSHSLGSNTRLHWRFSMLGDLFVVYNHNVRKITDSRWLYNDNALIVKLNYGLWM